MVFVAFAVAGTVIVAQGDPRHHGDNCEWDPFTGEVVCEDDTPTPTPTHTPTWAPRPTKTPTPTATASPTPTPRTVSPPSQGVSGSLTASKTTIKPDGVGSTRITAIWSPRDTDVNLDIHEDDRDVLSRSSSCTPRRTRSIVDPVDEGTATLTVYGCVEGSGRVVLKEYPLSENKVIATITITVTIPPPTTPEGSLSADPSSISAPGSSLVTATYSPANLGVEIRIISGLQSGECQSSGEGASDRSTTREDATLTRTVYGCTEGAGKVELWTTADPPQKLYTLTITVSGPPVPPTPTEASGSVSANRTSMDKGHSTTVTGTWTPTNISATLDVASDSTSILGAGGCPDGSGASDSDGEVSLQVHGCAVGTGTVELRTANGDLLDTTTIRVKPAGTKPPNPTGSIRALPAKIALGAATTIEADWRGVPVEPEIVVVDTSVLSKRADCPDAPGAAGGRSRRSADAPLVSEVSIKLYSCSHGSSVVRLWDEANDKTLAEVTVTVLEIPSIEDHRDIAYRWLNVTWKDSGFFVFQSTQKGTVLMGSRFGCNWGCIVGNRLRRIYTSVFAESQSRSADRPTVRAFLGGPKCTVGGTVFEMWLGRY